jgi:hypothetical protein
MKSVLNKKFYLIILIIIGFISSICLQNKYLKIQSQQREAEKIQSLSSQDNKQEHAKSSTQTNDIQNQNSDLVEYRRVQERARLLSEAKDLYGLVQLSNDIESVWEGKSPELYAGLMVDVCGGIGSYDFKDNKQYILARNCIKRALKRADQIPVEWQAKLVSFLSGDIEYLLKQVPEENWSLDRKERMKYWCDTWQRFENEIDENFDFEANRVINHPKLTDAERKRAEIYTRQRILRRDRESFLKQFQRFLVDAYTRPPHNTPELERFLQKCMTDAKLKESLLAKVQDRLVENEKNK